jgi:ABC-2 type transport system permease protein
MTATATGRPATARGDAGAAPGPTRSLAGTGTLVRFALRRDRVRIPAWIGGITFFALLSAASFVTTYPDLESRAAVAQTLDLPAMVALVGPNYAGADYDYGAMVAHQMLVMTAVVVGLMSVLLVVRHTRAEEESGRAELARAAVVGHHAPLAAAVVVVAGVNVVLAVLLGLALAGSGIETVDLGSSLVFGAALGAVGIAFAGVAAVTAQVTGHTRGASGLALAVLGLAYALRAVGDVGAGVLTWFSPIGWAQESRAYVDDRLWPLALCLALGVGLAVVGAALSTRRDVGAGLRAPRPGRAHASAALGTPLGSAVRLQRANLIGWSVAATLLGAMYGSVLGGAEDMLAEIAAVEELLPGVDGAALTDSFVAMVVVVLAMICTVQSVQAVLRLRTEETSGRAEPLLATAVSRGRWAAGHLAVAFGGGVLVLGAAGLGLGVAGAASLGDAAVVGQALGAAMAHVPAVWFTAAVAMALHGLAPRLAPVTWAVLAWSFFTVYLGGFLQLPAWLADLAPFGHVPALPVEELRVLPLVVLLALAAVLTLAGLVGLGRRDLQSTA